MLEALLPAVTPWMRLAVQRQQTSPAARPGLLDGGRRRCQPTFQPCSRGPVPREDRSSFKLDKSSQILR